MVSGAEFGKGPWQNVEWLIETTDRYYAEQVEPKGLGDRVTTTADRVVTHRKWSGSRPLIEANLHLVLRELNILYVPKPVDPGPGILFPETDLYGRFVRAKFRPLYELTLMGESAKYAGLGQKGTRLGPAWFGNTDPVLHAIGRTRQVILVEGGFDLLACRALVPEAPVLSSGTKTVSDDHIAYLQMLGVQAVHLLFDNEAAKGDKRLGAGNAAMDTISRIYGRSSGMDFRNMACPNDDPSMCLEHFRTADRLRHALRKILP